MKKRTRIIIILVLAIAALFGWRRVEKNITEKIEAALAARYPTESFVVEDVQLSAIPVGAKAIVHSNREEISFEVHYLKGIFNDAKDTIEDNFLESKTIAFYQDEIETRMAKYEKSIAGYALIPTVVGEAGLHSKTQLYPVNLQILISPETADVDSFIAKVKAIGDDFKSKTITGLDSLHFISFPGSVAITDLASIGFPSDWLTQPSPTPTPSPVPTPIPSGVTTETSETTEAATSSNDEATSSEEAELPSLPAFAYEIVLIVPDYSTDLNILRNATHPVTYSTRDLYTLADTLQLDNENTDLLLDARNRQQATIGTSTINVTTASK